MIKAFVGEDVFTPLHIRHEFVLNWQLMKKMAQSEKRILMAVFVLVEEQIHKCAKLRVPAMQLIINNDSDVICRGCQIGFCCRES